MNILYTITRYYPATGGAELTLRETALRLATKHYVTVAAQINTNEDNWLLSPTLHAPTNQHCYTDGNISVKLVPPTRWEKKLLFQFIARSYLYKYQHAVLVKTWERKLEQLSKNIDVFHNMHIGMDYFSIATLNIAKKHGKPFVFTPFLHPETCRITPSFKKLCNRADLVFVLSENERKLVCNERNSSEGVIRISSAPILSPDYSVEEFKKKQALSNSPIVLFIGQKLLYKGFDRIIKAAPLVWKKFPQTRFLFIGPGTSYSEKLFKNITDPRIIDLGKVDLPTKTAALVVADILCLPSSQESFGMVFLEAWAMGKPVIGGNIPAVREIIDDGVNGYLVSEDVNQLASRIIKLLGNAKLREIMGKNGQQKLGSFRTWDEISTIVDNHYRELVQNI